MFSHWSKMSLFKMSYYFKTVNYIRNQVVYNEGDPASHIFIVTSGDFKLTKKIIGKRTQAEIVILGTGQITGEEKDAMHSKSCVCTSLTG